MAQTYNANGTPQFSGPAQGGANPAALAAAGYGNGRSPLPLGSQAWQQQNPGETYALPGQAINAYTGQTISTMPSTPNGNAQTTPIIGATAATNDYTTKQAATNQIASGVQTQAQNVAQNQANNAANTNNNTSTQSGGNQTAGGNSNTSGGQVTTQGTTIPVDNSDLTNALNGATSALTGQPVDNTISNADAQTTANDQSLADDQATRDASTTAFNNAIAQIQSGTFPLNPTQLASLNQTQQAVNQLVASAQQQSQLYNQVAQSTGAKTGLEQFQPALALQNISNAAVKGQAAIAQAEMAGAKQLADLQQSFATDDFNMISKSYDALQTSLDKKDTLLNKMNSDIQTQVKDYQANQDKLQTNAKDALNTILTQLGGTAFKDLTPEAKTQLAQLEQTAGWPAGLVEKGLDTVAQQKAQAQQAQATQNEADRVAQQKIADEFRQATLSIAEIKAGAGSNGSSTDSGQAVGTTGSPTIDMTQPGYASQIVPGTGGLTQAAIDQDALATAMGEPLPVPLGLSSTGAGGMKRTAINNRMAEINQGGNVAANKVQLKSLATSLTQQISQLSSVQKALTAADNGTKQLISQFQSKGINNYSLPIANIISNASKYQLGNGDVSAFKAGLQEISNEYSQVFARGAGQTDQTRSTAQDILNGNVSIDNLQKIADELQSQGKIVTDSNAGQIKAIQDNINGIISGNTNNQNTSGASQASSIPTAPKGEINVVDTKTGQVGHIPIKEYDGMRYHKIQP